jgi:hypothetical protein
VCAFRRDASDQLRAMAGQCEAHDTVKPVRTKKSDTYH